MSLSRERLERDGWVRRVPDPDEGEKAPTGLERLARAGHAPGAGRRGDGGRNANQRTEGAA